MTHSDQMRATAMDILRRLAPVDHLSAAVREREAEAIAANAAGVERVVKGCCDMEAMETDADWLRAA